MVSVDVVTEILAATVIAAAPLLFAALGELISETAGVLNLGIEGMMLCGALAGVLTGAATRNILLALLAASLAGILVAGEHGLNCIVFGAQQVVSGLALNIFSLGLTTAIAAIYLGSSPALASAKAPILAVPLLSQIPILGPALFHQNVMIYAAFLLVPFCIWVLTRTRIGLSLRAAGEDPFSAEALGTNVVGVRWIALLTCGALAGLGGGVLSIVNLGYFTINITAGRGYIALASVVFGGWRALGVMFGILLFALADSVQIHAQTLGVPLPYQLLVALPYIVTVLALAVGFRGPSAPSALATNYRRE